MDFGDIQLNISAGTVAWYGAIIATIGFTLSAYNILRDKAHVKLNYGWDYKMLGSDTEYFKTEVINKGRRPVKITHVGARFHDDSRTMLFTSSFHKQDEERILTEKNPSTIYLTQQRGMKLDKLWYVLAIEARGR